MKNKINIATIALLLGCLQLHQPNVISAAAAVGGGNESLSQEQIVRLWKTELTSIDPQISVTPIIVAMALDIALNNDIETYHHDPKIFIAGRNSFGISEQQIRLAREMLKSGFKPNPFVMEIVAKEYGLPMLILDHFNRSASPTPLSAENLALHHGRTNEKWEERVKNWFSPSKR